MAAPQTPIVTILALWAAGLGAGAQFAKIAVIFPLLGEVYADAGVGLGFLMSIISFVGIAFGLVAGIVVSALGARRLLVAALVLGAGLSAAQSLMPALPVFLVLRFVEGVSHLIIVVAAPTLIGVLSADRHRGATMTLWSTFFGVAFAATAWLGLPLAMAHGPAALFLAHASYMAAAALALVLALPEGAVPRVPLPAPGEAIRRHVATYASPAEAAPALAWLFYTLSYVAILTVLPLYLAPGDRSLVVGVAPLGGLAVSLTAGVWLLRRYPPVRVVVAGFVLAAAVAPSLVAADRAPWLAVLLVAALGLVQGANFAAIPALNPEAQAQARANGAVAQMGNLGNTLGTPLLLAATAAFGLAGLAGFAVACFAAGAVAHLALARARAHAIVGGA